MDGRKESLTNSLQFQLSAWLSGAVILLALSAGAYSFWSSFQEANELQDDQLRQVATLINRHGTHINGSAEELQDKALEPDLRVVVQVLGNAQTQGASGLATPLALPHELPDGLQTVRVADASWRFMVRTLRTGQRVAVGQQTEARDEIARNSALRTVLPLLLLIPALAVLVCLVVRHQLKPVARLALALDQRTEYDLDPLPQTRVPAEIRAFTHSISRLLLRLGQSMEAQRRFVADAAHELRSPLAALSLQAEALDDGDLSPKSRATLARLRQGMVRASALIDQLLTLARSQVQPGVSSAPVAARSLLHSVIEDLIPHAQACRVDLGVIRQDDVHLRMPEVDLHAIMRNLVDNAIRYSPAGGRVDVSLARDGGGTTFDVASGGAGIPLADRERVFDPFYRVLGTDTEGSGLGLSIVKTLAERAAGSVTLHSAWPGEALPGLRVQVQFPVSAMICQHEPRDALDTRNRP